MNRKQAGVADMTSRLDTLMKLFGYQDRFIDFNKIAQNSKYKIWRMQVEEGKTPTPYTPSHRDERYIDLSGIDNSIIPYNITQSGSSLYFNGVDSAIQIPLHKMISGGTW